MSALRAAPTLRRAARTLMLAAMAALPLHCESAGAATVTAFSPQGETAQVRQVRAGFSEPMVPLGTPNAPPPFVVDCPEPASGRWADPRTWVYDFRADLPPGTRCRFTLKPGLRSASGGAVTGRSAFAFDTGGPAVVAVQPYAGREDIDEEQVFVLTLNGAATEASVRAHAHCEAEHLGERIPVRVVGGADREALLARLRLDKVAPRVLMLQCERRLPNSVRLSLVWGKGIATASGILGTREQRFAYTVRRPFEASFTCERENARAPCMPLRPLALEFSAPVARAVADAIRLQTSAGVLKPRWRRDDAAGEVRRVEFPVPVPESSTATIALPADLRDETGRALDNAASFPLTVRIGAAPALAKFPGRFGILEAAGEPMLPVTVRNLDPALSLSTLGALPLASVRPDDDREVIGWLRKLHRRGFDFERPDGCGDDEPPAGKAPADRPADCRQAREVSLLAGEPRVERRSVPLPGEGRALEVVGIPFPRPGFYVAEIESPALGAALLGRQAPLFVRGSVLVTNLAVHFKRGRENALAWVTTLDTGRPVAGAEVRVSDCEGKTLWQGATDRDGLARLPEAPVPRGSCQPHGPDGWGEPALFVSARSGGDFAFVLSNWNDGIERWRFGVPTADDAGPEYRAHTLFDRTLLRAGETVSMKHLVRRMALHGFAAVPAAALPDRMRIRHVGTGQEFEQPLEWRNGSATTQHRIAPEARLGEYEVVLERGAGKVGSGASDGAAGAGVADPDARADAEAEPPGALASGRFRVAEFRLPVLEGRLVAPSAAQVAVRAVPYTIQLGYVNGGAAAGHDLAVSAVLRPRVVRFAGYEAFRFGIGERAEDETEEGAEKLVADRLPLKLDRNGSGRIEIRELPPADGPRTLRTEASFFDPNGERQTLSASTPLWPSAVVAGIRTDGWVSAGRKAGVTVVVLDTQGEPVPATRVDVRAESLTTVSHRRRLVGGFYAYQHRTERKTLGEVCSGRTDARGRVLCDAVLDTPGRVVLTAEARDPEGNRTRADASLWVTEQGELWFESESQDRMDVVPERRRYEPGESARLQLRMPFRHATVLVAVEREGVIDTLVREVSGRNPTVDVPIKAEHGPNVFVSVLAVRGRLREVPWYSVFTWGWRSPVEWWHAWREWRAKRHPKAMVDLARPAFKYGLTEIQVGVRANELTVSVTPARATYRVRETARVKLAVRMPDGKPAPAGTEVAFAAVDQALLELQPNLSWKLLEAMLQRRGYAVETATAQMQVVGKRHFGRKAVTHGGGGGKSPPRELLDTLLLWNPRVALDAAGEASVEVPVNDALTRFALVAIADVGTGFFGTGTGSLTVVQDLQIVSGLPPLVRGGDVYRAAVTLRNTSARPMQVRVEARAGEATLAPQTVDVPAGEAREAAWAVSVPEDDATGAITWEIGARNEDGSAQDALRLVQKRAPRVPVTVQQATLVHLTGTVSMPVAAPAGAQTGRGGLQVALAPRLGVVPPGVRRYFEAYPLTCLEQKASRAIGLRDRALWQQVVAALPVHVDDDGLARYFPGDGPGSDVLTAYLLAVSHESGFALPESIAARMQEGLAGFIEGRIARAHWSPRHDLDVRKLAAADALSRYGRLAPRQLDSIAGDPDQWPTGAVIDWLATLSRLPPTPSRAQQIERAQQGLRARLAFTGTRLGFSTEADDHWWWLMTDGDVHAARLILATLAMPGWRTDLPRLVTGALGRQVRGRWSTTTANAWGSLAMEKFGEAFERARVGGRSAIAVAGGAPAIALDWAVQPQGGALSLPWPRPDAGAAPALRLAHAGTGAPWATIQSLAAVPLAAPQAAGFGIRRSVAPVEQKERAALSRGDIVRVHLEIDARNDMTWVVVNDPVPAGATILGSGLGRDSGIGTRGEQRSGSAWPAFEERGFEFFRAYYAYVPKGTWSLEYTLRLNNEGTFGLPPTRVEAMYAPEMFGELPNAMVTVRP